MFLLSSFLPYYAAYITSYIIHHNVPEYDIFYMIYIILGLYSPLQRPCTADFCDVQASLCLSILRFFDSYILPFSSYSRP